MASPKPCDFSVAEQRIFRALGARCVRDAGAKARPRPLKVVLHVHPGIAVAMLPVSSQNGSRCPRNETLRRRVYAVCRATDADTLISCKWMSDRFAVASILSDKMTQWTWKPPDNMGGCVLMEGSCHPGNGNRQADHLFRTACQTPKVGQHKHAC